MKTSPSSIPWLLATSTPLTGGKRFDGDALMELIKTAHAAGKVYVWNVTEPEVHIEGDIAWITYVNRGSIQDASGTKSMNWLESAVLTSRATARFGKTRSRTSVSARFDVKWSDIKKNHAKRGVIRS